MSSPTADPGAVDAHHHLWQLARGDYGWLTPKLAPIYRDFMLPELVALCRSYNITATVLVQAAPTIAETRFLLEQARASGGLVQAVVGWADLSGHDAGATITGLARDPLLKAIRPMLQNIADPNWILGDDVQPALSALAELNLRFEALVKPAQLPALRVMIDRHPGLAVAIDHGAKPAIAEGAWSPWAENMQALAANPKVFCKLSGLVTEAGPSWTPDTLRRYVEHLFACFGVERMLWGSDWPVVELGGGMERWSAATKDFLAGFSAQEQAAVLGGNARRFYGF